MQEASLVGVLKVILIIFLIYYGLKVITRLFGPLLFKYATKKVNEKFQQHFQGHQPQDQSSREGDVTVEKNKKNKSINKDVGEYIDYEEID